MESILIFYRHSCMSSDETTENRSTTFLSFFFFAEAKLLIVRNKCLTQCLYQIH